MRFPRLLLFCSARDGDHPAQALPHRAQVLQVHGQRHDRAAKASATVAGMPSTSYQAAAQCTTGCNVDGTLFSCAAAVGTAHAVTQVFAGKDGYITPRDLLRWGNRSPGSDLELAQCGYMLLAERLRRDEEKLEVRRVIEKHCFSTSKQLDVDGMYYTNVGLPTEVCIAPVRQSWRTATHALRGNG